MSSRFGGSVPAFAPGYRSRRGWRAAQAVGISLTFAAIVASMPTRAQTDVPADVAAPVAGPKPNWLLTPSVSIDGTYTDNVNLTANKQSDFVTRLNPGIRFGGASARASANLNYQWQHYAYAESSARNNQQRSLAANGSLELVERWLFIEGSHNTSQQSTSAFGTRGVGNELLNANRTETASYRLAPYIKGVLFGVADYQLRYEASSTRSDAGALAGSAATTRSWNGRLAGATPLALLGWSLAADNQRIRHGTGFESTSRSVNGTLTYQIDPQVRLLASAGRESDDFTSAIRQQSNTSGVGIDWAPTERTKLSLKKDRHTFGDSFGADFSHRTALTAWKLSDSRNIRIPTPQMAQVATGTIYDLLYLQLASSFPDPAARAAEANRQLAQAGIAADAPIFGQIQTSQAYIDRRQQVSVALIGVNNTVTFAADRSNSQRLGTGIGLIDDFALSSEIRQSGFNVSWAHKLTPHAALTINALTSRSGGSGNLQTSINSLSVLLTGRVGVRTTASVGLRQTRYDGSAVGTDYNENALTGALLLQF